MKITQFNFYYFLLLVILLLVYLPLIGVQQLVDPDAQIILANLEYNKTILDYLSSLVNFRTIDFQPVRDATLWIDLLLFKLFSINTFGIQNVIWWSLSCFFLFKISLVINKNKSTLCLFLLLICFSTYPLFAFTVSWGMARKHLLALFFILLATYELVTETRSEKVSSRSLIRQSIWYLFSILSQPIHILWPLWAILFSRIIRKTGWVTIAKKYLPMTFILAVFGCVNYLYYNFSPTFLYHYPRKISDPFAIGDKLLAAGHYHFQLFFPYLPSFNYSLGDKTVLPGFFIFLLFFLVVYKLQKIHKTALVWLSLGYFSLVVMLSDYQLYDTYLLLPGCSLYLFLSLLIPLKLNRKVAMILIFLALFWGYRSYDVAKLWTNTVNLTRRSFENRPSCKSAMSHLRISYEAYLSAPRDAKEFIESNGCIEKSGFTAYTATTHLLLTTYIMFHEDDFPLEKRIEFLKKLAEKNPFSKLTLAALHIKYKNFVEADNVIEEVIKDKRIIGTNFHPISAHNVHPYCEKKKWPECLAITSRLNKKPNVPYL